MFATVRPTPRRYPHRLRPGRDPVRHPATALDQPRHAAHARSVWCAAAHIAVSAPLGGSRTAHHPPIGAQVRPDWPPPRPG